MNKSESIAELAKALAQYQAVKQIAVFDSEANATKTQKYKYASFGSVVNASHPMHEFGLSFSMFPSTEGWYCGVDAILMHESGEWISGKFMFPMDTEAYNPAQEAGKIISYAKRYALSAILGIVADEDVDGQLNSQETASDKQSPKVSEERPYKPDVLKEKLRVMLKHVNPASDKQRKFLAILLGQEFSDDDIRHDAQEYLFGARSLNDIDGKMVNAALKWLSPEPDSGGAYVVSELAKKELSGVQSAFLMSKGQQKMDDLLSGISK